MGIRYGKSSSTHGSTLTLRLGIDARPLEHPHNGIGRYTTQIVQQIQAQTDWELCLFTSVHTELAVSGARVIQVPDFLGFNSLGFQFRLAPQLRQLGLDAYFSPRHHLPMWLKVPSVLTIHDVVWHRYPETMNPAGKWLERLFMPPSVRQADAIIAVSASTRRDLITLFPQALNKTRVIHEAGDQALTHAGTEVSPPCRGPFVLAVGTIEPRKNYPRLLAAFDRIAKTRPNLQLVIAGGPGWKVDVDALLAAVTHRDQVQILNRVDDEMLLGLYQQCQFLAVPSLYEGFCLPIVEAMACGKAILTSDCSAMPEIAADAGELVNPLDVDSIADGLVRLLDDAGLRRSKEDAALLRSQSFSWERAGAETVALIASTIEAAASH